MACKPEVLRQVPLFALLDDEETAVLAAQVELKAFAPRQRIWKIGDSDGHAYVIVSGAVRVTTVDEDQQEVVVDEPAPGEFFGPSGAGYVRFALVPTLDECERAAAILAEL